MPGTNGKPFRYPGFLPYLHEAVRWLSTQRTRDEDGVSSPEQRAIKMRSNALRVAPMEDLTALVTQVCDPTKTPEQKAAILRAATCHRDGIEASLIAADQILFDISRAHGLKPPRLSVRRTERRGAEPEPEPEPARAGADR